MEARRVESVGGDPIITRIIGPGPLYAVSQEGVVGEYCSLV